MSAEFHHVFTPGSSGRTILALHGTGGTEHDLVPLAQQIDPLAGVLSPRGQVLENGMPRFFRRVSEGVFDEEDLVRRTHDLAKFVSDSAERYKFELSETIALGYSNGANIACSLLLLEPGLIAGAALLRPMVPIFPDPLPDLRGTSALVSAGHFDPIVPTNNARKLVSLLEDSGADVTARFENAGHGLTEQTVATTEQWFANFPRRARTH